jgi:hypothetical protein
MDSDQHMDEHGDIMTRLIELWSLPCNTDFVDAAHHDSIPASEPLCEVCSNKNPYYCGAEDPNMGVDADIPPYEPTYASLLNPVQVGLLQYTRSIRYKHQLLRIKL